MKHRTIIAGGGTGGHLYPALSLTQALKRLARDEIEILLVGAERGVEARVLPETGLAHRLLPLEPIYRSRPWRNWRLLVSAVRCGWELHDLFRSFRPSLVVGTGGYAAGPVVAWGLARGLPAVLQEQNRYPGLTTRLLAPYVDQLHLGYGGAMKHLWVGGEAEVHVHGNPIRWPEERPSPDVVRAEFGLGPGRVVLVVGGSQGAAPINQSLIAAIEAANAGALPALPPDAQVLWSTGPAHYADITGRLGRTSDRVAVRTVPYISRMEWALSITTLAISRAGALTLSELCAWGIPAILVPLPHAAADHQRRNARALEAEGAAIVLEETRLLEDPGRLWLGMLGLLNEPWVLDSMAEASRAHGNPHAADDIAADLWRLMEDR